MVDTYSNITKNYLNDLYKRRSILNNEIIKIDNAITQIKSATTDSESLKTTKDNLVKNRNIVTESEVRDAVKHFYDSGLVKNNKFDTSVGYFSNKNIVEYLGLNNYNPKIKTILNKFAEKGILEHKPYRKGRQYRYVPVKPDKNIPVKTNTDINSTNISDPVPGVNNKSFNSRNKDIENIVREVIKKGFKHERTGSDHIRIYNKTGQFVTLSATGNKAHEVPRLKRQLAKIGIIV